MNYFTYYLRQIRTCLVMVAVALTTACNSDIFLDGAEMPQETTATIAGDGGEASFIIQQKGLEHITIDYYGGSAATITYYNHANEEIVPEERPAKELSQICFRSMWLAYNIDIEKNRITVHTVENISEYEQSIVIRLTYDYTVKFITLTVETGKPMEVTRIDYNDQFHISSTTRRSGFRFINNSSLPQQMAVNPYRGISGSSVVTPAETWANYYDVQMKLPVYVDGSWIYGEEKNIQLSAEMRSYPKDWETTEYVDIPANASVDIITTVTFSEVEAQGEITFQAPVSGKQYATTFKTNVIEPISYEIISQEVQ